MQAREFENLMDGKPAKMFDMLQSEQHSGLMGLLLNAQQKKATPEQVEAARSEIKKVETEISALERQRMDKFINDQRAIGTKERAIRRMVQRMWNITVI